MSNIYDLYKKYDNKLVDDNFFNIAFEKYIQKDKLLLPFINDFKIIDEDNDKYLGTYSNENRVIKVNKTSINNSNIERKNILGLQVLRHELEHARNLQKLHEKRHDIESKVILYSLRDYALSNNLDYIDNFSDIDKLILILSINTNYDYNPGERIADIKSWKYMVNLLKNQKKTNDLLFVRTMLYHAYTRGYDDNRYYLDPPTFKFLLNTNQLQELKQLKKCIDKNDYSLETRILCGLPISYDEKSNEALKIVRLKKKTLS